MMRYKLLLLVPVFLLAGCGYSPEDPVYDTAANPDGFPPAALAMLDGIESGQVDGYEAITDAFGELYLEHTELLDNDQWRAVIERLGSKFRYRGDRYREQGPAFWLKACMYYQLASFARVNDSKVEHTAAVFQTWWRALDNGEIDASILAPTSATLTAAVDITRRFALGTDLQREFFERYLKADLEAELVATDRLSASTFAELPELDRVLLAFAGYDVGTPETKLASFMEPRIDLVAMQLTQTDSTSFDVEAYFRPLEPIDADVNLVLRISQAGSDTLYPGSSRDLHYSHVEIAPEPGSSKWSPQHIEAVKGTFEYSAAPGVVHLGLAERTASGIRYLPVLNGDESLILLDSSIVELH